MTRAREEKSGDAPILERGLDIPKRTTLAERLKAEQRKREGGAVEQKSREAIFSDAKREAVLAEPKREEAKQQAPEEPKPPLDFAEAAPGTPPPPRQFTRTRRPAGPPPQRRLATPANDDLPS
ncbi:MAG TPA: hypothetical protein DDW26_10440, partial [Rhizobiales bacterium]|nr:hypothetical protein [Hyphomicrobiales bacterium]